MTAILTARRPGLLLLGIGLTLIGAGLVNWPKR